MSEKLMILGTMSGVGKSIITAGICRLLTNRGYSVCPFKSQNMSSFYHITEDGGLMSSAQALQAAACRKAPSVLMNPILLKPTGDRKSQVYFKGKLLGEYSAADYYSLRKTLIPEICSIAEELESSSDYLIIEGAGGCAEINLREDDCVNMGLAQLLKSPVIIVGDIEPGGAFAQLYGSFMLLDEADRSLIKGFIINKFRGDINILTPGIRELEEKTGIPVLGTIPWREIKLPDEDSYSLGRNIHADYSPISESAAHQALDDLARHLEQHLKLPFL